MRILFRMMRIMFFRDPAGLMEDSESSDMSVKDIQFFMRDEFIASSVESFRQSAKGATRDFTIERIDWPFQLEDIHSQKVLVFHVEIIENVVDGIIRTK